MRQVCVVTLTAMVLATSGIALASDVETADEPVTEAQTISDAAQTAALALQFQRLITADKRSVAVLAEQEIWRLWFAGDTEEETTRLSNATMVMQQGGLSEAIPLLMEIVADFPAFSEARNQLAFARFLQGDLDASLEDIAAVLELEPRHFGALAGRARIEAAQGRLEDAQRTMGKVGEIHPWMARLSPIRPDPPPPPPPEVRDL